MSDRDAEPATVGRVSTGRVGQLAVLGALVVMLVGPSVSRSGPAAATVGFVLAEALVLYVGYGVLVQVASPAARELLAST